MRKYFFTLTMDGFIEADSEDEAIGMLESSPKLYGWVYVQSVEDVTEMDREIDARINTLQDDA